MEIERMDAGYRYTVRVEPYAPYEGEVNSCLFEDSKGRTYCMVGYNDSLGILNREDIRRIAKDLAKCLVEGSGDLASRPFEFELLQINNSKNVPSYIKERDISCLL